jgi:hypothetical protein
MTPSTASRYYVEDLSLLAISYLLAAGLLLLQAIPDLPHRHGVAVLRLTLFGFQIVGLSVSLASILSDMHAG